MYQTIVNIANKSTCNKRKVGCVICDSDMNIISTGYNKVLAENCCRRLRCNPGCNLELCNSIHAEMMASMNVNLKNKKVFVNIFPCPICSKYLALSGIKELYFYEEYPEMYDSFNLLKKYGVKIFKLYENDTYQEVNKVNEQASKGMKFFGE